MTLESRLAKAMALQCRSYHSLKKLRNLSTRQLACHTEAKYCLASTALEPTENLIIPIFPCLTSGGDQFKPKRQHDDAAKKNDASQRPLFRRKPLRGEREVAQLSQNVFTGLLENRKEIRDDERRNMATSCTIFVIS